MPTARRPEGLPLWGGRYSQRMAAATLTRWGTVCHLCRGEGATTADHLVPRSKGGTDSTDNLRPAHQGCNSARNDTDLEQWFATHPVPHRQVLPPSRRW